MKTILLIGDSIRLHYQPHAARAPAGLAEVSGPVENCQSSAVVRDNLDAWVISRRPDIVHIDCGAQGGGVSEAALGLTVRHLTDIGLG